MRIAILIAALGLALCSTSVVAEQRPRAKTHTVKMLSMRFQPETLTVSPGDTIVWVNEDVVAHTATSAAGGFDSKLVAPEKTWRVTLRKKGTFPYVCTYHPTMTGTLRVK